jgi:hypothetical protein
MNIIIDINISMKITVTINNIIVNIKISTRVSADKDINIIECE